MNPVLLERLNNMEEGELYHALFFDGVAKCYNRAAFELQPFKRVAIIDLDSLKWLNDTFGHRTGDYYLRQLAKELSSAFGSASVFRLSGDEFAVTCSSELYLIDKLRDVQSKVQYFSWGESDNLIDADTELRQQKLYRERVGLRSPRGETPPWSDRVHIPKNEK